MVYALDVGVDELQMLTESVMEEVVFVRVIIGVHNFWCLHLETHASHWSHGTPFSIVWAVVDVIITAVIAYVNHLSSDAGF